MDRLDACVRAEIAAYGRDLRAYLHHKNPDWQLVGRITFRLAENKRDEEYPFAFLATYASSISDRGDSSHLPLARGLQEYAGTANRKRLVALLTPIRDVSEQIEWGAGPRREWRYLSGARMDARRGIPLSNGRAIARSFWGKAWCENLESYRDYESRLPRGRSYVRNGSVLDLKVASGEITALVSGSEIYQVAITIKHLAPDHWRRIKTQCAGNVGSVIELLEGRLSERVMQVVTHRGDGLFPKPAEIQMDCSCPDWATMCKHVAAVMYGVGARLDQHPELLFTLRNVDHADLISQAIDLAASRKTSSRKVLADEALGDVFGIEIGSALPASRRYRPRSAFESPSPL